jgi:hypothetical protein
MVPLQKQRSFPPKLWYIFELWICRMLIPSPDERSACFLGKGWNMKSYSMVATAALLAANWLGAAQQPGTEGKAGQKDQSQVVSQTESKAQTISHDQGAFYILAEFTQSLNAKKLKPGDRIQAQVTQDVLSHGKIIIPVESKLVGHVTEVKARATDDSESRLGIIFDKVLLKHRLEVDFRGVLHALSAPAVRRSRVDEPDQMLSPRAMGGMSQSQGPMPIGTGMANSRSTSPGGGSASAGSSIAANPAGSAPPFMNSPPVNGPPSSSAGNAAGGIPNPNGVPVSSGEQKPMSVGMPLGVFGLKGLSLTPGTSSTPGPVILSRVDNVKLESGTQVLLKITGASVPQP